MFVVLNPHWTHWAFWIDRAASTESLGEKTQGAISSQVCFMQLVFDLCNTCSPTSLLTPVLCVVSATLWSFYLIEKKDVMLELPNNGLDFLSVWFFLTGLGQVGASRALCGDSVHHSLGRRKFEEVVFLSRKRVAPSWRDKCINYKVPMSFRKDPACFWERQVIFLLCSPCFQCFCMQMCHSCLNLQGDESIIEKPLKHSSANGPGCKT